MAVNARDQEVQCDMEIEMELNHDLLDCAALGDLDRLEQLLTHFGANVNTTDSFGQGVLHMAVKNGRLPCLKYILEYMTTNGPIEAEDLKISLLEMANDFGQTPLIVAAMKNSTSCLDTLLGYGAEVNATDNMGRTALHLAAMYGHPVCVEILVNSRANLDMVDRWRDNTALHLAASHDPSANCLGLLLKAGACIDTQNKQGYTALHLATEHNREKCVALLASMGASRDLATHHGLRPQDLATREACWRLLVEPGEQGRERSNSPTSVSLGCMGALAQRSCRIGNTSD